MEHEWQINTGTVPEGVGPDTMIEVEWMNGVSGLMYLYTDPVIWEIEQDNCDIIRWRFM